MFLLTDKYKNIIIKLFLIFFRKSPLHKIVFIILIILTFLVFARIGLIGMDLKFLSYRIIPTYIPIIDSRHEPMRISSEFSVLKKGANQYVPGKTGGVYKSGDQIKYIFNINNPGYVIFVCIDKNGVHIINTDRKASFYEKGGSFLFTLDNIIGHEVYYLLASERPFSYESEIRNTMLNAFNGKNQKGPDTDYYISPPNNISIDYIHFLHAK